MARGTWVTRAALPLALLAVTYPSRATPAQGAHVVVVVHATNPVASLSREQVSRMFLKKLTRWPDGGGPVYPADLAADSPLRAAFSDEVLGKSVSTVRAYWNARIFTGRDVPPPEKGSEADALAHVAQHAGAIAYVSPSAALPPAVRAVPVTK